MIRPLRLRHRRIWTLLAPLLPLFVWASLSARPPEPPPVEARQLGALAPDAGTRTAAGPWRERAGIRARRLLPESPEGKPGLELELEPSVDGPDLLVYWVAGPRGTEGPEALADAWLLGEAPRNGARVYSLPEGAADGTVVIYSLAHRSLRATLELPAEGS